MKKHIWIVFVLLNLMMFDVWAEECRNFDSEETTNLVNLVDKAAVFLHQKNEMAFSLFATGGTVWCCKTPSIFVFNMQGEALITPQFSKFHEKDPLAVKDADGKPFVQYFLDQANRDSEHAGWVHFRYPKPKETKPVWQTAYVKRALDGSGNPYLIGSVSDTLPLEPCFLVETANEVLEQLTAEKEGVFETLNSKTHPFYYRNVAVAIINTSGIVLINPFYPNQVGMQSFYVKDEQGRPVFRELVNTVVADGYAIAPLIWKDLKGKSVVHTVTYAKGVEVDNNFYIVLVNTIVDDGRKGT